MEICAQNVSRLAIGTKWAEVIDRVKKNVEKQIQRNYSLESK